MKNSILWIALLLAMYNPLLGQQEPEDFSVKGKMMLSIGSAINMNYSAGLLTGVRFYPLKNLGLFFEGGYGPMENFNFGLVGKY